MATVLVLWQGHCGRYFGSLWAHVSLNDKCLWVYDLWRQKATKPSQPCRVHELHRGWEEGGLGAVLSRGDVFVLQFLVCKRKLESKKEALLILSKELDTCQQERDQYKLMANQLRERHQSLKKKYRELIVRMTLPWRPCSRMEIERGPLNTRSLPKSAESRQLPTGKTWKSFKLSRHESHQPYFLHTQYDLLVDKYMLPDTCSGTRECTHVSECVCMCLIYLLINCKKGLFFWRIHVINLC